MCYDEEEFKNIVEKLGFDIRTYNLYIPPRENDRIENSFEKLTMVEIDFLCDNKLLGNGIKE